MTTETALLADRTEAAFGQWPTLGSAYGCMDCGGLFRTLIIRPLNDAGAGELAGIAGSCPHCSSRSVFDAAAVLRAERAAHAATDETTMSVLCGLIERIDEVVAVVARCE